MNKAFYRYKTKDSPKLGENDSFLDNWQKKNHNRAYAKKPNSYVLQLSFLNIAWHSVC